MIPRLPPGLTRPLPVGDGAFSTVVRARQPQLDRNVAVKILEGRDAALRADWMQEAKTLARLGLDCVPEVYDVVESDSRIFIVMQWLRGVPLQPLLETGSTESRRQALAAVLCAAVARLHATGVAHRDLKPANILLCPDPGRLYLVDFGFARESGAGKQSMAGMVKGTPAYMAPESWRSGPMDFQRADLFALGRILREIDPGVAWETAIAPLLAEDPARRPASAQEWWRLHEDSLPKGSCDWKEWIEPLTAGRMAQRLRQGARELMIAGRREEAYWLLAESLEENPDSEESLQLVQALSAAPGLQTRKRTIAASAAVSAVLIGLVAAFHFGRETGMGGRGLVLKTGEARLFLPPPVRRDRLSWSPGDFKSKEAEGGSRLAGFLQMPGGEACATISLDGKALSVETARRGLSLPAGEHQVECAEASGRILGREKTRLLPFQRKTLRIPAGRSI